MRDAYTITPAPGWTREAHPRAALTLWIAPTGARYVRAFAHETPDAVTRATWSAADNARDTYTGEVRLRLLARLDPRL